MLIIGLKALMAGRVVWCAGMVVWSYARIQVGERAACSCVAFGVL